MNDINFCYRIEPAAEMAYNTDTGESAAAYCKISFGDVKKLPTSEDQAVMHKNVRNYVAQHINKDPIHVTPISFKEWVDNQEDEVSWEGQI
ncbi:MULTISPECIES: hypothetical protein [unclassified Paenibacillus]|uniref:hypothetical protein n=1 Tax=unclassified Paenibacillus TaxID=185978 RepID=UPI00020D6C23|nr:MULTISPECIES: hypothetical protein [unclassified Paenibacillus]EGL15305.1 hypothetical protein HMPREF9413_5698 [Paenibacillus sp. HGF7]EPD80488.1 hypothetical protein HMPREF1207_05661 [Paenibacillus sp. HGH0039]